MKTFRRAAAATFATVLLSLGLASAAAAPAQAVRDTGWDVVVRAAGDTGWDLRAGDTGWDFRAGDTGWD